MQMSVAQKRQVTSRVITNSYTEKPEVRSEAGSGNLHMRVNLEEEADQAFTLQKFNVPS